MSWTLSVVQLKMHLHTHQSTCAESGENGASVPFLVAADYRLVNTASLMESNVANHVLMVTETKTNGSATLKRHARSIATEVGVNSLLVLPAVVVESSLACTKSPKKPCMGAKCAQRRTVLWRTIHAAQRIVSCIARATGMTSTIAPMVELAPTASNVVQEEPRVVVSLSRLTTRWVDADAKT